MIVSEGMSNQLILLDKVSDLSETVRLELLDALRRQRELLRAQKPQTAARVVKPSEFRDHGKTPQG